MESRWQLAGGGGNRVEGLSKKKKGLTAMDSSVVTAGGGGVRGLKGNVNKYTKIKFKKKFKIKMYLLECDHLPCYFLKLFFF